MSSHVWATLARTLVMEEDGPPQQQQQQQAQFLAAAPRPPTSARHADALVGEHVEGGREKREAARAVLPDHGRPGWDYVLIGRAEATDKRPFDLLKGDLVYALRKLHGPRE